MAKTICACGTILRDDDPDDSLLLLSRREFNVDLDSSHLFGVARIVLHCPTCMRLWVFWEDGKGPTEYLTSPELPDNAL